jgi:hypothetical protein
MSKKINQFSNSILLIIISFLAKILAIIGA